MSDARRQLADFTVGRRVWNRVREPVKIATRRRAPLKDDVRSDITRGIWSLYPSCRTVMAEVCRGREGTDSEDAQ